eukprot:811113-Prymnesium_polylepis.1
MWADPAGAMSRVLVDRQYRRVYMAREALAVWMRVCVLRADGTRHRTRTGHASGTRNRHGGATR